MEIHLQPTLPRILASPFTSTPTRMAAAMEKEVTEQALADARAGLWERAESLLEALAEELTASPEIYLALARRRTEQNRIEEAASLLRKADMAMGQNWGRSRW